MKTRFICSPQPPRQPVSARADGRDGGGGAGRRAAARRVSRNGAGFTLIELLVVIAIIAILAAMIFPALAKAKVAAKVKMAQLQMGSIVAAVNAYEAAYSRLPVSTLAMNTAVNQGNDDFTYGTYGVANNGITDAGTGHKADIESMFVSGNGLGKMNYQTNNSEVMAILMDKEYYPNSSVPTVNLDHLKNPQKVPFLNATINGDTTYKSAGVGPDLVYRDPWANPYIISMDLNSDEKTRDSFYRQQKVSQQSGTTGFNGLGNSVDPLGNGQNWEASGHVMVWSAGPDKMIDTTKAANIGANKDNILSWK